MAMNLPTLKQTRFRNVSCGSSELWTDINREVQKYSKSFSISCHPASRELRNRKRDVVYDTHRDSMQSFVR